jgi:hypothetical protein
MYKFKKKLSGPLFFGMSTIAMKRYLETIENAIQSGRTADDLMSQKDMKQAMKFVGLQFGRDPRMVRRTLEEAAAKLQSQLKCLAPAEDYIDALADNLSKAEKDLRSDAFAGGTIGSSAYEDSIEILNELINLLDTPEVNAECLGPQFDILIKRLDELGVMQVLDSARMEVRPKLELMRVSMANFVKLIDAANVIQRRRAEFMRPADVRVSRYQIDRSSDEWSWQALMNFINVSRERDVPLKGVNSLLKALNHNLKLGIKKSDGDMATIMTRMFKPASDTSPAPRQPSPVPRQQSPVPRQQSPVPRQQSPVPRQQSPVPRERSPVPRQQSPVPQEQTTVPQEQTVPQRRRQVATIRRLPDAPKQPRRESQHALALKNRSGMKGVLPVEALINNNDFTAAKNALLQFAKGSPKPTQSNFREVMSKVSGPLRSKIPPEWAQYSNIMAFIDQNINDPDTIPDSELKPSFKSIIELLENLERYQYELDHGPIRQLLQKFAEDERDKTQWPDYLNELSTILLPSSLFAKNPSPEGNEMRRILNAALDKARINIDNNAQVDRQGRVLNATTQDALRDNFAQISDAVANSQNTNQGYGRQQQHLRNASTDLASLLASMVASMTGETLADQLKSLDLAKTLNSAVVDRLKSIELNPVTVVETVTKDRQVNQKGDTPELKKQYNIATMKLEEKTVGERNIYTTLTHVLTFLASQKLASLKARPAIKGPLQAWLKQIRSDLSKVSLNPSKPDKNAPMLTTEEQSMDLEQLVQDVFKISELLMQPNIQPQDIAKVRGGSKKPRQGRGGPDKPRQGRGSSKKPRQGWGSPDKPRTEEEEEYKPDEPDNEQRELTNEERQLGILAKFAKDTYEPLTIADRVMRRRRSRSPSPPLQRNGKEGEYDPAEADDREGLFTDEELEMINAARAFKGKPPVSSIAERVKARSRSRTPPPQRTRPTDPRRRAPPIDADKLANIFQQLQAPPQRERPTDPRRRAPDKLADSSQNVRNLNPQRTVLENVIYQYENQLNQSSSPKPLISPLQDTRPLISPDGRKMEDLARVMQASEANLPASGRGRVSRRKNY